MPIEEKDTEEHQVNTRNGFAALEELGDKNLDELMGCNPVVDENAHFVV